MYNTELQKQLEDYLKKESISRAKAAPLIGLSAATLSLYMNSNYQGGNIENVEQKIVAWMDMNKENKSHEERTKQFMPIKSSYLDTSISSDIYKRIRYCQLEKGMIILHGDAGIGKTKAAEKFAKDNPQSCVYIQLSPSAGTLANCLKIIAMNLKVTESSNRYITSVRIKQALIATNKTLIIDEAQFLKMSALEEIRNLSDTDGVLDLQGSGIVLIGNTEIYNKMLGRKSAAFAQLYSRIKMNKYYQTSKITMDDVKMIFTYLKENKLNKELEFMLSIARSNWGIRGAVNVYNNAVNNEDVSFRGLYAIASDMGIGVL